MKNRVTLVHKLVDELFDAFKEEQNAKIDEIKKQIHVKMVPSTDCLHLSVIVFLADGEIPHFLRGHMLITLMNVILHL